MTEILIYLLNSFMLKNYELTTLWLIIFQLIIGITVPLLAFHYAEKWKKQEQEKMKNREKEKEKEKANSLKKSLKEFDVFFLSNYDYSTQTIMSPIDRLNVNKILILKTALEFIFLDKIQEQLMPLDI